MKKRLITTVVLGTLFMFSGSAMADTTSPNNWEEPDWPDAVQTSSVTAPPTTSLTVAVTDTRTV